MIEADDLGAIQEGHFRYTHKGIDFLYNCKSKSNKIIVTFHAAVGVDVPLPVFRGRDWDIEDVNILTLSDSILKKYRPHSKGRIAFDTTFFLNTEQDTYQTLYADIIGHILSQTTNGDAVFMSSSAGGLAALHFGAMFDGLVILGNSQFYLESWWNIENTKKVIHAHDGNQLIMPDIDSHLKKHGPPHKLILFTNTKDEMCFEKHHQPLITFFEANFPNHIDIIYHDECWTKSYHTTHFPLATPYRSLLETAHCTAKPVTVLTDDLEWCRSQIEISDPQFDDLHFVNYAQIDSSSVATEGHVVLALLKGNIGEDRDQLERMASWVLTDGGEAPDTAPQTRIRLVVNDFIMSVPKMRVIKPADKKTVVTNG